MICVGGIVVGVTIIIIIFIITTITIISTTIIIIIIIIITSIRYFRGEDMTKASRYAGEVVVLHVGLWCVTCVALLGTFDL